MPNHLHLLAAFRTAEAMRKQCYSWMKYTATQINRLNDSKGSLWQEEPFDPVVRSEEQLDYLRRYIAQNPLKSKLPATDYLYQKSRRFF
jgi:REP element-mobilizing transposase RayT